MFQALLVTAKELCLACHCSDSDEMFVLSDRLHLSFVIPITSETANLHFAQADNKHTNQPGKYWEIGRLCGVVCLFKSAASFPTCSHAHGFLKFMESVFFSSITDLLVG